MPAYPLGPGAWLGDFSASGPSLNPPIIRRGALSGSHWQGSGLNPEPKQRGLEVGLNPPIIHRALSRGASLPGGADDGAGSAGWPAAFVPGTAVPWQGIDPAWVYEGGDSTLLATALRRVQVRIDRAADPRIDQAAHGGISRNPEEIAPLWRWASEYRVRAVVADLTGRFFVRGSALWQVDIQGNDNRSSAAGAPTVRTKAPKLVSWINKKMDGQGRFAYEEQVDKVLRAAVEREERLPEILTQAEDLWPFFHAITGISSISAPITAELFDVAWRWADHYVMAIKHEIAELRPVQRGSRVVPIIETPGHGSLPSGHATISAMTAQILVRLLYSANPSRADRLDRLARRIAFNRVVAGVHFQMDSYVGYELGRRLACVFIGLATGEAIHSESAAEISFHSASTLPEFKGADYLSLDPDRKSAVSPTLQKIWRACERELENLRIPASPAATAGKQRRAGK